MMSVREIGRALGQGVRSVPTRILIALGLVVVLLLAATLLLRLGSERKHYTLHFTNSTGLYVGDHVKVLGVTVGSVDKITPRSGEVQVEVTVTGGQRIPADAGAAIVAPTLVTGRYVQFAPVYDGGPELADKATVPIERTATPMEFDQTKKQLIELIDEVGPKDGDQRGSLNRFLDASAKTVDGNGRLLRESLDQLSQAAVTMNTSGDNIFATIRNISTVTSALSTSDEQIRGFTRELAQLSGVLNTNRTELDTLIKSMNITFDRVTALIEQNRDKLTKDVTEANKIAKLLVDRMDSLDQVLHVLPTGISDYYNIYDPIGNSLTGALAIPDVPDPQSLICGLLTTVNAPPGNCAEMTGRLVGNAASAIVNPGQGTAPRTATGPAAPGSLPALLRPPTGPGAAASSKPSAQPSAQPSSKPSTKPSSPASSVPAPSGTPAPAPRGGN